ncbi:ubiquitin-specific protease ESD4 [Trifolium repens]|nr:ubiquitin-specific protease ESD4 [Trifolium repens]
MDNCNNEPLHFVDEMLSGSGVETMNLGRSVHELTVVVNKALCEIADLKSLVVALDMKKLVDDMGELKTLVAGDFSNSLEELKSYVVDQQKSIDNIHGSLKLIEVVMCTKSGNDNPMEPVLEPTVAADANTNVVDVDNDKDEEHRVNVANGKRKFVDNEYESELDKEKELANIDLTFTDEDDDDVNAVINKTISQTVSRFTLLNKQNSPKPALPDAWTNIETRKNPTDLSTRLATSSFRRVPNNIMDADTDALNQISKKLFQSPYTTPNTTTQGKRGGSSSRGKKGTTASVAKKGRMVLPRGIKWNFAVTSDMQLDLPELQALAYIYHPDKDKQKTLVKSKGIEAFRYDFDTLRPGAKIMTLVCGRAMWVQENYNRGAVWYLPPAFADDIFLGIPINQLIDRYCKDWMPPYPKLKYIYVPINTANDHWFLMVLSVQLGIVYHLDSHCRMEEVASRRATMTLICEHLHEVLASPFYGTTFWDRNVLINEWPIEEARGIPNCGHSNNAAVWLMDWIDMHQCFTPNLQGELKENTVRAKTAALLVIGLQNDIWTFIEDEAKTCWELITA